MEIARVTVVLNVLETSFNGNARQKKIATLPDILLSTKEK